MTLIETSRTLAARVERLSFAPPVSYTYNPLICAREPDEDPDGHQLNAIDRNGNPL
jgi:hypothetical protein